MREYSKVIKDFESALKDLNEEISAKCSLAIESLLLARESGYTMSFDDAVKLARLIHLYTEPNIGAGALYDWSGLEEVIYEMEIAQEKFEESCKVSDDKRDFAWEADAASVNSENARMLA
jgi:hypothetical protein